LKELNVSFTFLAAAASDKIEDVTPEEPCQAAPRQSNGIPTKKKYVTLPKSVGAASAAPVAQYVPVRIRLHFLLQNVFPN